MNQFFKVFMLATTMLFSLASYATTLDQAKSQGFVGERNNGYLALLQENAPQSVKSLVISINEKRKAVYNEKAVKAGVSLKVMETRIAQRLQQRAISGHYIQMQSGEWHKK